jgi:hypothetical protein
VLWLIKPSADWRFVLSACFLRHSIRYWALLRRAPNRTICVPSYSPTRRQSCVPRTGAGASRPGSERRGPPSIRRRPSLRWHHRREGRNYVVLHNDPTAHAELLAVAMPPADSRSAIFRALTCIRQRRPAPCARAHCTGRASVATITKARIAPKLAC